MKFLKSSFFIVYNLFYQLLMFWILLFAQTYLNFAFIPQRYLWNSDGTRKSRTDFAGICIDLLVLSLETALLMAIIMLVNKVYANKFLYSKRLLNYVTYAIMFFCLFSFGILIWGS